MTALSPHDFQFYQTLLLQKSGLSLSPDKSYLLITRLSPIASSLGYETLEKFTMDLRSAPNPALLSTVIEAMTTNETSFFRDTKPYVALRELLPALMKARENQKMLRIWSAACSSGQECYSLAIVMQEFLADKPGWNCQIHGTDISQDVLDQAKRGEYSQFEIQRGLTIQMMVKHFMQDGSTWRVKDHLRNMVRFQRFNLLDDPSSLGKFDIVFCRNVLIYFNSETKGLVLNRIAPQLYPDGLLFLGACETTINLPVPFEGIQGQHGILRLKSGDKLLQRPVFANK